MHLLQAPLLLFFLFITYSDASRVLLSNATAVETAATGSADGIPATGLSCSSNQLAASYVLSWTCPSGYASGAQCTGVCVAGTSGSATAVCGQDGRWNIDNQCLIGGIYGFDDGVDGSKVPQTFLGLIWQGMRVANARTYAACNGYNGYKHGMVTPTNVAYTLEASASSNNTAQVQMSSSASISAPTKQHKITVLGLYVTAAWQDGLTLHISSWNADGSFIAVKPVTLSFLRPLYVDLRVEPGFQGIHKLTFVGFGGVQLSCNTGTNVVIDNVDVRLHPLATLQVKAGAGR